MTINTTPWDPAENINTAEDVAAYLDAALEDGDPDVIRIMVDAIARSEGIAAMARASGVSTDTLVHGLTAIREQGAALHDAVHSLGLRIVVTPIQEHAAAA